MIKYDNYEWRLGRYVEKKFYGTSYYPFIYLQGLR